jgi:hypothetical protein
MPLELEVFDDVTVILLDLLAGGPQVFPVGFRRERELVAVGRYVAPQAGVPVPMPNTSDVGTLFQNGEVGEAGLPESRATAIPAMPAPTITIRGSRLPGVAVVGW